MNVLFLVVVATTVEMALPQPSCRSPTPSVVDLFQDLAPLTKYWKLIPGSKQNCSGLPAWSWNEASKFLTEKFKETPVLPGDPDSFIEGSSKAAFGYLIIRQTQKEHDTLWDSFEKAAKGTETEILKSLKATQLHLPWIQIDSIFEKLKLCLRETESSEFNSGFKYDSSRSPVAKIDAYWVDCFTSSYGEGDSRFIHTSVLASQTKFEAKYSERIERVAGDENVPGSFTRPPRARDKRSAGRRPLRKTPLKILLKDLRPCARKRHTCQWREVPYMQKMAEIVLYCEEKLRFSRGVCETELELAALNDEYRCPFIVCLHRSSYVKTYDFLKELRRYESENEVELWEPFSTTTTTTAATRPTTMTLTTTPVPTTTSTTTPTTTTTRVPRYIRRRIYERLTLFDRELMKGTAKRRAMLAVRTDYPLDIN